MNAAVNGTAFTYDARGNLTSDGIWAYAYDTENNLVSASKAGLAVAFTYDAIGRRMWKYVTQAGVTTSTAWLSVGDQEMAEFEGVGTANLKSLFVYGSSIDEALAQIDATDNLSYLFTDALGSTIVLTNASGQLTEKHAYTAFGLETIAGPGKAAFRFAGRRIDPETGLYHSRARAYSPNLGRFLQTYPIGTADNINLYAYVANDPLNRVDPTGEVGQLANYASNSFDGLSRAYNATTTNFSAVTIDAFLGAPPNPSMLVSGAFSVVPKGLKAFGPLAEATADGLQLDKSLASAAQTGEAGQIMAGVGGRVAFRGAERIATEYGGNAADWVKKTSSSYSPAAGASFETHWVENLVTGQRVEFKTKFPGGVP